MSKLFFEGAHVWNEVVVRVVFNEEEVEQLLRCASRWPGALERVHYFGVRSRKDLSLYA